MAREATELSGLTRQSADGQVPWIVDAESGDIQAIVFYGVSGVCTCPSDLLNSDALSAQSRLFMQIGSCPLPSMRSDPL